MYQSAKTIQKRYEISRTCLAKWGDDGLVRIRRMDGGKRLYHSGDIDRKLGCTEPESDEKEKIIYARVSSSKQKGDLERQVKDLKENYPNHKVYRDIGSGLNYKRKNFEALLERVMQGTIGEIVVSYRDRLCRYGFELIESICRFNGTKILVHFKHETEGSESELSQDLMAVCNFFVAQNNGYREGKNKKRKIEKDEVNSDPILEGEVEQVDGDLSVDL